MPFVVAQPEQLAAASSSLQEIEAAIINENAAAALPTTGVISAAADAVSALTAVQFAAHAQLYQSISAQAATIRQAFAQNMLRCAESYASSEAANAIAAE